MELGPGSILLGKYRVDEVLGTGGMGRVVRASHLYLQQSVAIKLLLPQMVDNAATVSRFLGEAQATVQLKSEHIAKVFDVGTASDGSPFMVMEYLDGNDLNQILRHHGPQPPRLVVDLMLQACEGLAEAHALGIIHRDIKPSNFFITRRNDGSMLLKILDFGISKTPNRVTELTGTQTIIGTPTYMAPEQMKSGKGTDPRSDVWSLGIVMYQLLAGRPPFTGESYAELVIKVSGEDPEPIDVPMPAGLGEVILHCLDKDPKFRHQNVGDLARQLAPFASDPVQAAQSSARSTRILQHRTALRGQQGSPLAAGGGLATPAPISPAQLTPRNWPATSTSMSGGAGQMTAPPARQGRGFLIAGVASLVILAGAGGFIVNEVISSRHRGPAAAATQPALMMPATTPAPATATGPAPLTPATTATVVPAAPTAPATDPVPAVQAPVVEPSTLPVVAPTPTPVAMPDPAPKAAAKHATSHHSSSSTSKSSTPATKPAATKPTATKPAATKPTATKPAATKPTAAKPAATKPTAAKPATTKPAKNVPKPAAKGLFDGRH